MPLRLHRCSATWVKSGAHPCWAVQKALDKEGVDYEVVKGPLRKSKRDEIERLSGQRLYPVIEFEDGRVLREESTEMEERIRSARLLEEPPTGPTAWVVGHSPVEVAMTNCFIAAIRRKPPETNRIQARQARSWRFRNGLIFGSRQGLAGLVDG